jgi:hypothetical protein
MMIEHIYKTMVITYGELVECYGQALHVRMYSDWDSGKVGSGQEGGG